MAQLIDYLGVISTAPPTPKPGDLVIRGVAGGWTTLNPGPVGNVLTVDVNGSVGWSNPAAAVINATDKTYGADPTGQIVSDAGIQSALNDASAHQIATGGYVVVYLPTGIYLISKALLIKLGVRLLGDTPFGTTLRATGTVTNFTNGSRSNFPAMVKWDGGDMWAHGVGVRDLQFDPNGVAGLSASWFQSPGEVFIFDRLRCSETVPTSRTLNDAQLTAGSNVVTFTTSVVTEDDVNAVLIMGGGVANPGAPILSTAATGGTIGSAGGAQTFTVGITYLTANGETPISVTATVTVPAGTTNTITITSPPTVSGAIGWFAYVSQPGGGGIMTRQQAPGAPTAIGTNLTLTAPPTNTGATPYKKIDRINWSDVTAAPPQATAGALTMNDPAAATLANASITVQRPTDPFVFDGGASTGRIGTLNGVRNSGALLRLKNFSGGTWLIDELSGDDNQGGVLRLSAASNAQDPAHVTVLQMKVESDYYNANWMWSHDPPVLLDRCGPVALNILGGSFIASGYGRDVVRIDQPLTAANGGGPSIFLAGVEGQNWFNAAFINIIRDTSTGKAIPVSLYGTSHSYPNILWGRNQLFGGGGGVPNYQHRRQFIPMWAGPDATYSGATWTRGYVANALGVFQTYNNTNLLNDGGAWYVDLSAGTWTMTLAYGTQAAGAIVTLDFSADLGLTWTTISTLDTYSASIANANTADFTGIVVPVDGSILVRARATGRNALNTTGYYILLSGMEWRRTA